MATVAEKQHHVQGEVKQKEKEEESIEKFKEQMETTNEVLSATEETQVSSDRAKELFEELFGDN